MLPENFSTLIDILAARADVSTDKTAFTFNGQAVTFGELWQGVNRFATFLLECGVERDERVVVALPNSAEFLDDQSHAAR